MGKRFTSVEKWDDPWFQDLPMWAKCFWHYICDKCDCAGVWKVNKRLADFQIGSGIEWSALVELFDGRIRVLSDEKWLISGFIKYQYGKLSPDCKAHIPIFAALKSNGLRYYDADGDVMVLGEAEKSYTLSKGYPKGIHTLMEKEMEKDNININNNNNISKILECDLEARSKEEVSVRKKDEAAKQKHKYGEYGWVLLTDEEHSRLLERYGEKELAEMIDCVDGTAERTENKAGYKRWRAVIDNCAKYGWHKRRREETDEERRARIESERRERVKELEEKYYQIELERKAAVA